MEGKGDVQGRRPNTVPEPAEFALRHTIPPGSVQPGFSRLLFPEGFSYYESRSLILSEDLPCRLSLASGARRKNMRPDGPAQVASNLHPLLAPLATKRCSRLHVKAAAGQSETSETGSTV